MCVLCWMCCAVLDQTSNTPGLLTSEMDTNYLHISPTPHSCHAHPAHLLCPAHSSALPTLQVVELRPSHSVLRSEGDVPPGCQGRRGWTLLGGGGGHTPGCPILEWWGRGRAKGELVIITHLFLHKHLLTYLSKKDNSNVVCLS